MNLEHIMLFCLGRTVPQNTANSLECSTCSDLFKTIEAHCDLSMSLTKTGKEISIIWHSLPPVALATGASGEWLENVINK